MLTLERQSGRYRSSALILLLDGHVIGEITVQGGHTTYAGNVSVHLGLHLPGEIRVVRADAVNRPDGPSFDWLREREEVYNASGGYTPPAAFPTIGVISDGPADGDLDDAAFETLPGTLLDAAPEVPNDYLCQGDDDDDLYPDPGWGEADADEAAPHLYVLRGRGGREPTGGKERGQ